MAELGALPTGADPNVHWAIESVRDRHDAQTLYEDYYEGTHRLTFATDKFRNAFGDLFREFADNFCDDVVDEPVDRMQIIGWVGKNSTISEAATAMHEANKLDARLGVTHRNAYKAGDGYLMIWTDPDEQVRWYVQDPRQIAVEYDAERPDVAKRVAKVWKAGKAWRVTVYTADTISRFTSKGSQNGGGLPSARAFEPYVQVTAILEDGTVEAIKAVEPNDTGRVPVFHYPTGEVGAYGRSVLKDVIPLQDALNKSIADMLVGMEYHSMPQRWATGVQLERDEAGREVDPFRSGANRVWTVGKDSASFGQFPAADLAAMLEVQDGLRLEIARKGALPPHSVNLRSGGGHAPSGISLLVSEGKTIKRVKDACREWGAIHREAMAYALTMSGVPCTADDLEIEWAPAETRDEKALIETLILKQSLKVGDKQLLLEAGYDDDQATEWLDEATAGAQTAAAAFATSAGGRPAPAVGDVAALTGLGVAQGSQVPAGAPLTVPVG